MKKRFFDKKLQIDRVEGAIRDNAFQFFKDKPEALLRTLNALFHFSHTAGGKEFEVSKKGIGDHAGIHGDTALRQCKKLREWGLIDYRRRYMATNVYVLNEWLLDVHIRDLLRPLFKSLRVLLFMLLVCPSSYSRSKYVQTVQYRKNIQGDIRNSLYKTTKLYKEAGDGISSYVKGIENLGLTRAGQIKLSAFSAECIEFADERMGYCTRVRNRFNWFMRVCLDWSKRHSVAPMWDYVVMLMRKHKIPRDMPMELNWNELVRQKFADLDEDPGIYIPKRRYESVSMKPEHFKQLRSMVPESKEVMHQRSVEVVRDRVEVFKQAYEKKSNPFMKILFEGATRKLSSLVDKEIFLG